MDAWGTLDIGAAAIVRDDLGSSIRRARKLVSRNIFQYIDLKKLLHENSVEIVRISSYLKGILTYFFNFMFL